jgi:hypothetical protein
MIHILDFVLDDIHNDQYKIHNTYQPIADALLVGIRFMEESNQSNVFNYTIGTMKDMLGTDRSKIDLNSWDIYKRNTESLLRSVINNLPANPPQMSKLFYELLKYEQKNWDYFRGVESKREGQEHDRLHDNIVILGDKSLAFTPDSKLPEDMRDEIISIAQKIQI